MLASTTAVPGTPLAVTVEQPMSAILERPRATIRALGIIAILLAMLGAVIAWIIGRQLARPLVELTGAAETLARGDYSERVTSRGTDEIGRLSRAFNRMAEQVQESSNASTDAVRAAHEIGFHAALPRRSQPDSRRDRCPIKRYSPSSRDTAFRRSATTAAFTSPTTTARCVAWKRCITTPRSRRWFASW